MDQIFQNIDNQYTKFLSDKDFINYVKNFQDVFYWVHYNDNNEQVHFLMSPSAEKTFGYTIEEMKNMSFSKLYYNLQEREYFIKALKTEKQVKNYPLTLRKKDGTKIYTEIDGEIITENLPAGVAFSLRGVCRDVTQKVKENLRIEIAYLIAEKSQRRLINLNQLGKFIYDTLNEIIKVSNFYIAVYDRDTDIINFPYFKDKYSKKQLSSFSIPFQQNGLTEYIIKKQNFLRCDKSEIEHLINKRIIKIRGKIPSSLIGVPLKSEGLSVGAIVVQNYNEEINFAEEDVELLKFIASQIAVIIDRKLWQDKLIKNEEYFRALVENSSEIIGVINKNGVFEYISESVHKILQYYPYELIGRNVSEFIDIKNIPELINERIIQPKVENLEVIKIYNKEGKKRYLEVSIANSYLKDQNNGIIINAKDITHRVLADKKREFTQKRLATLHQIEKALISDKPLQDTLNDTLQIISNNIFDVDRTSISLVHHEEKEIEIIALKTKYKKNIKIKIGDRIPFSESSSIKHTLKHKAFCVKDISKLKTLLDADKKNMEEGLQSFYIKPIVINNKTIACINFSSFSINYFNHIDEELLNEIVLLLAVVINDSVLKSKLSARENDLSMIFNLSNEGILKVSDKGDILFVNKRLCEMLGYTEKELVKMKGNDILYKEDKGFMDNGLKKQNIYKYTLDRRYQHKNGDVLDCRVSVKPVYVSNKLDYTIVFIENQTEKNHALKQVNDLKNALTNSASVFFTDTQGYISDVNKKLMLLSGYTKRELIGKKPDIFSSSYHSSDLWRTMWETINAGKTWRGEIRNKKKDGSIYWVYVTITPIFNSVGEIEQFISIQFDITEEKKVKSNLIKEVIEAQEHERERFAMEIHDGLGQILLATKMNLSAISDSLEGLDSDSRKIFNKSLELLTESIQEARNISHGLMSRVLNRFGLAYALDEIINNINSSAKIKFNFTHNINKLRFNEDIEMAVYRTLQELIKNIIKHSKASEAWLSIYKKDNNLNIEIKDNGIGIKQSTINLPETGGIGLRNMKSRIEYLEGSFMIDEKMKKGTKIKISITLKY